MLINKIGVHHAGGTLSDPLGKSGSLTLDQINLAHKARDFNLSDLGYYVGYSFVIFPNGEFVQTRLIGEETCAAKGANFDTVHICLIGNFEQGSGETPTYEQKMRLKSIIQVLIVGTSPDVSFKLKEGTIVSISPKNIYPHRILQPNHTSCYGSSLSDTWAKDIVGLDNEIAFNQMLIATIARLKKLVELLLKRKSLGRANIPCSLSDVRG